MTGRAQLLKILKLLDWIGLTRLDGGRSVDLHEGLVVRRKWITNHKCTQDLTLSRLLPGPNRLVAVFVGYRAHGLAGALRMGYLVALTGPRAAAIYPAAGMVVALGFIFARSGLWRHAAGRATPDAVTPISPREGAGRSRHP